MHMHMHIRIPHGGQRGNTCACSYREVSAILIGGRESGMIRVCRSTDLPVSHWAFPTMGACRVTHCSTLGEDSCFRRYSLLKSLVVGTTLHRSRLFNDNNTMQCLPLLTMSAKQKMLP